MFPTIPKACTLIGTIFICIYLFINLFLQTSDSGIMRNCHHYKKICNIVISQSGVPSWFSEGLVSFLNDRSAFCVLSLEL